MSSTTKTGPAREPSRSAWVDSRLPFVQRWRTAIATPGLPRELPYLDLLPVLITGLLVFLAASGLVLTVYYQAPHGYASLQFIDRDVHQGWLIHDFHETGTTVLFGLCYLMLFRNMLIRSYRGTGDLAWVCGVAQFALLLLVGWLGYVLIDGAVSAWSLRNAATAAQNFSNIPGAIGTWFFGGPDGPGTLGRMAVFHAALGLAVFGIVALHRAARRAAAPIPRRPVAFHPYYTAQVFVAAVVLALIFVVLAFFLPHFGENPLNAAPADRLIVPLAMTPPWYLIPIGALAGIFPGTYGPLIGVILALAVLTALPWLDRAAPGAAPSGRMRILVWVLGLDVLALGLDVAAGPSPVGSALAVIFAAWYFLHFLVLTPLVTAMESK
jgi:ubiquinol-cytochrome c reductase cytochrome b subunit